MKKRTVILTALSLAAVMVFAGCKKEKPEEPAVIEEPEKEEPEKEPEEEPEEPEEPDEPEESESYITQDEVTYGINDLELQQAEENEAEAAAFAQEDLLGAYPYKIVAKRDIHDVFLVKLAYDEEGIVQGDELICSLDEMKAGDYIYLTEIIPEGMPSVQITWSTGSKAREAAEDTDENAAENTEENAGGNTEENAGGNTEENPEAVSPEHSRLISQSGLDGSLLLISEDGENSFTEAAIDTEAFFTALNSCINWGGDAGSSLKAMQAAANLLTWTADNPTYAINTRTAFEKFWFDLSEEERTNFHDNFYNSILSCGDEMSVTLTVDGIESNSELLSRMDDAGVTEQVKAAQENGDLEAKWPMLWQWIDSYMKVEWF